MKKTGLSTRLTVPIYRYSSPRRRRDKRCQTLREPARKKGDETHKRVDSVEAQSKDYCSRRMAPKSATSQTP